MNANYLFDLKSFILFPRQQRSRSLTAPLRQASAFEIRDGVLEGGEMMNLAANEHEKCELFV
jgi:hypothetical protein